MQRSLDRSKIEQDFIAAARFLKAHELSNGKLGAVGFCFGGYVVNLLAATIPNTLDAGVPFYGTPAAREIRKNIKTPLLIQLAELDERVNASWRNTKLTDDEHPAKTCERAPHFAGDRFAACYSATMAGDLTQLLIAVDSGDARAAEELLPLVYEELRRLAARLMAREKPGQTLQPTALVHEAWLKLAGSTRQGWHGRRHFFAAAAESMRRILIDRARRRMRMRHGHGLARVDLSSIEIAMTDTDDQLLAVNESLEKLALEAPDRAELVKLRYFAGFSISEAAEVLEISESTAKRQWNYARLWLLKELQRQGH